MAHRVLEGHTTNGHPGHHTAEERHMKGSVVRRGRTWSVVYDEGRDQATGKRRQRWKGGFRSKEEAEKALRKALSALDEGTYVTPGRMTLGEWMLEHWLPAKATRGRKPIRATTRGMYETFTRAYVLPRVGQVPLQDLTAAHLDRLYTDLLDHGGQQGQPLAPNTVKRVHSLVHKALDDAMRKGLVVRNVAALADQPYVPERQMAVWWPAQTRAFLDSVHDDRLAAAWLLLCTTGMRRSELLGLPWSAVDLDAGRVEIRQTVVMVGTQAVVSPTTKTERSRRLIDLDQQTVAALKAHRTRQLAERLHWGEAWTDVGLVFVREDGTLIRPEWLTGRFRRLAAAAGLPPIRLHDLRHSFASAARDIGVPIEVLSAVLGHSRTSITQDIYVKTRAGAHREAVEAVSAAILGA